MKTLIIIMLNLPLVLFSLYQVQGKGIEHKSDDMTMSQSMESNDMKTNKMMGSQAQDMVPTDDELKIRLTPLQYAVTRGDGTSGLSIIPTGIITRTASMSTWSQALLVEA